MIPGTSYSPAKAFVNFCLEFFSALAVEDYQAALGKLDSTSERWSKARLLQELRAVIGAESICSPGGIAQSASPELQRTDSGFTLRHRLPVAGTWAQAKAIFEFQRKANSEYFKVFFRGFEA